MKSGRLDLCSAHDPPPRFARVGIAVDTVGTLYVSDRMGQAWVAKGPLEASSPDALSEEFSREYLAHELERYGSKPVKGLLVDQSVVRGIGNAYADEILWHARIAPQSLAEKIPGEVAEQLLVSTREVLEHATREVARIDPDATKGEVRDFLRVHRKGVRLPRRARKSALRRLLGRARTSRTSKSGTRSGEPDGSRDRFTHHCAPRAWTSRAILPLSGISHRRGALRRSKDLRQQ